MRWTIVSGARLKGRIGRKQIEAVRGDDGCWHLLVDSVLQGVLPPLFTARDLRRHLDHHLARAASLTGYEITWRKADGLTSAIIFARDAAEALARLHGAIHEDDSGPFAIEAVFQPVL